MEPSKIEKQFRKKLNSREIRPSQQAWDRLDAMLSVAEEKKTKPSFGWLYIAASILVLISAGTFFFNQKNTEDTPTNSIVVQEKDSVKSSINKIQNSNSINKPINSVAILEEPKVLQNLKPKTQNAIINQKTNTNQISNEKEIEYQKTQDIVLNDLPKIQNPKVILTKNELNTHEDQLLLASLDKVLNESSNKTTSVKVNPKSLLSQVDGELNQTFRETRLEKIQRNFKTVKVALANRNNQ